MTAKKYEVEADKEFEEAETEEEIEEIFLKNERLANELEGAEVVEISTAALKSKLDMADEETEYKGRITTRVNAMRLRSKYYRTIMKAKAATTR